MYVSGKSNNGRLDSMRGEIQASIVKMIQNMESSDLEELHKDLNSGSINAANIVPAAAKASNKYTEQERVQKLESWRNRENNRLIDAAIASGESPEDAAVRVIEGRMKQQETTEQMVALAKKYRR